MNEPTTIREAVNVLVSGLSDSELKFIRENDSSSVHHTVGRNIRNEWGLWNINSPLRLDAVNTYKIAHPDDISGLIFAWVWALVRNETFDPYKECERFHKHWEQQSGMTSLEAGGWPPKDA